MKVEFDPEKLTQLRELSDDLFPDQNFLEESIKLLFDKLFGDRSVTNWKPGSVFYAVLQRNQGGSGFTSSKMYLLEVFHCEKNIPLLTLVLGESDGYVGVASVGFDPFQTTYYTYPEIISKTLAFAKALLYQDDGFQIIVPAPQGGYRLAEHCG